MKENPYYEMSQGLSHSAIQKNTVLRNTYWLLALSMIPTILGAWFGLVSGINYFMLANPGLSMITFLGGSFGLIFLIEQFKNRELGIVMLLIFTGFMGMMLSQLIGYVLGFSNGPSLIILAFSGTAAIFFVMASIATVSKRNLEGLSQWLLIGSTMLIIASFANIWLRLPALVLTICSMTIVIFSAFILVDLRRVISGGETNYITATLQIYLNLYNIFVSLLRLITFFGGNHRD